MIRGHRWDNHPNPPSKVARGEILAIREETKQAVRVAPEYFFFYQRRHTGRRCSCWNIEAAPAGHCTSCWATGFVGGYEKWGCKTEIIDVTYPALTTVNVVPNYSLESRPIMLSLAKTAGFGYVDATVSVPQPNCGLDLPPLLLASVRAGNYVLPYCKVAGEGQWVELNEENLLQRSAASELQVRVWFKRDAPEIPVPHMSSLLLRWRLRKDILVPVDIPRIGESKTLEELGVFDSYTEIAMAFDTTVPIITNDDFLHHERMCKRWKIVEAQPNAPEGINTSWDCQSRLIQQFEPYVQVP
jgi:hypothetical protein